MSDVDEATTDNLKLHFQVLRDICWNIYVARALKGCDMAQTEARLLAAAERMKTDVAGAFEELRLLAAEVAPS